MVPNAGALVDCVKQAVMGFNADPKTRVIVRIGEFGAEHVIEHVKVRGGMRGPEIIIQAAERPNLG